jgi:hypothetical protein
MWQATDLYSECAVDIEPRLPLDTFELHDLHEAALEKASDFLKSRPAEAAGVAMEGLSEFARRELEYLNQRNQEASARQVQEVWTAIQPHLEGLVTSASSLDELRTVVAEVVSHVTAWACLRSCHLSPVWFY